MSIKELWDEYRIAKQMGSISGYLEDSGTSDGKEVCMKQDSKMMYFGDKDKSAHKMGKSIWVERVDIPEWFYHEVGYRYPRGI